LFCCLHFFCLSLCSRFSFISLHLLSLIGLLSFVCCHKINVVSLSTFSMSFCVPSFGVLFPSVIVIFLQLLVYVISFHFVVWVSLFFLPSSIFCHSGSLSCHFLLLIGLFSFVLHCYCLLLFFLHVILFRCSHFPFLFVIRNKKLHVEAVVITSLTMMKLSSFCSACMQGVPTGKSACHTCLPDQKTVVPYLPKKCLGSILDVFATEARLNGQLSLFPICSNSSTNSTIRGIPAGQMDAK
jgi:hypothetical protein